jgi:hypothetical protein
MTIIAQPASRHKRIAHQIVYELGAPDKAWRIAQSFSACVWWVAGQSLNEDDPRDLAALTLDWLHECGLVDHGSAR